MFKKCVTIINDSDFWEQIFFVSICLFDWIRSKVYARKNKIHIFLYMLLLQLVLINGQWHTFFFKRSR